MSNIEKLQGIKTLLLKICKGLKLQESYESFEKADFTKLNKKLFISISYILVKSLNNKYLKSLPWPISNKKDNDVFITELLKIVDVINKDYAWVKIPHFTRSHFSDPRPENDKVVEFLRSMTFGAIHILTDIKPGEKSVEELRKFNEELKITHQQLTLELIKAKAQEAHLDENIKSLSNNLNEKHQELIEAGILSAADDFKLPKIRQIQDQLETELIQLTTSLHNYSLTITLKH